MIVFDLCVNLYLIKRIVYCSTRLRRLIKWILNHWMRVRVKMHTFTELRILWLNIILLFSSLAWRHIRCHCRYIVGFFSFFTLLFLKSPSLESLNFLRKCFLPFNHLKHCISQHQWILINHTRTIIWLRIRVKTQIHLKSDSCRPDRLI
jgi:hypothetical protein